MANLRIQISKIILVILLPLLAIPLLVFQTSPAHAQGPLQTPTPYPAIVATQTAAQQAQSAAQADLQQAAQLRAQAAEMERNGQAQYNQAQADISAARAAQAAQNAAAAGEAIGRVEATINQMRDTVAGQAGIIATLTTDKGIQAQQHISDTVAIQSLQNEVRNLTIDKKTIQENFNATSQSLDDAKRQSQAVPVVTLVIGVLFSAICAVLLIVVLNRKGQAAPFDPHDDNQVIDGSVIDEQISDNQSGTL